MASSSMQTRSSAARAAAAALRHPQCDQFFKEGLRSVFRQWTGLELAVFHQWGGPSSTERAESLMEEVLGMFQGVDKIYKDDISFVLEDYMELNFNTILEDGSTDELGELLVSYQRNIERMILYALKKVTMWRECCTGDFTIATNALAREYVRHEVVSRSQGLAGGDAIDSDDEDDGVTGTLEGIDEGEEGGDGVVEMEEEVVVPRVDADGWETVVRGTKKVGKKK